MIWSYLLHLSYNMWSDAKEPPPGHPYYAAKPFMRCDPKTWRRITDEAACAGFNMLIIDLGDAVRYESHPEIALRGAWSVDRLRRELDRLRSIGLEPIPKLNFSTCHDTWMGQYHRMVSTPAYYKVCADLIAETIRIFNRPKFFHLGMDEEDAMNQRWHDYLVIRQNDLWWDDLAFLCKQVERGGARPWVWSDYMWNHPDRFFARMSRSVLQSNWYYETKFSEKVTAANAYVELEKHRYDQVPAGSNWSDPSNLERTVRWCSRQIAPKRLLGFMQTVWYPTLPETEDRHMEAVECGRRAIKLLESHKSCR